MNYLEITTKNGLGRRTVELRGTPLRVGRSSENDIVLRDTRVSRHHCVIELAGGKPIIRDLGSRRGIKVNNRRREESDLRPGDRVRIGPFIIALREDEPASGRSGQHAGASGGAMDAWITPGLEVDSEETATPDRNDRALADDDSRDESGGDSQGTVAGDDRTHAALAALEQRIEALAGQLAELATEQAHRDAAPAGVADDIEALRTRMMQVESAAERVEALEAQVAGAAGAASQAESADQRATESASRLDDFATAHERLSFEHAQVARAVQDLASRLDALDESMRALSSLPDRMTALEHVVQQSTLIAGQALEQATQLVERLEQTQALAHKADERITEIALNHAEFAGTVTAHEETLDTGSRQLVECARMVEELRRRHESTNHECASLQTTVKGLSEQLVQMHEWSDALEQRLVDAEASRADAGAVQGQAASTTEAWNRELSALRESLQTISVRLTSRLERLEGASADAAPELSALKEQVRRLSDSHATAAAAAGRTTTTTVSKLATSTGTAVMDRPRPMPKQPAMPAAPGVPASVDAEQSRQVMSRIFQPKQEQDERYRPVRDRSMIVLLVFVLILALGVAIAMFSPMLRGVAG